MEFQYIKATEFCTSVRDGTHDTPKQKEEGYKLVTGKHIKNGVIDSTDAYYISEEDYNKINERSLVEQWDVLMSMIGTVGEVAVVKNTPDYAIKNIALFKCGGSELKGKWLSYYLKTPEAIGYMTGNQKGSSQQFLSLKQLRELPIAITSEKCMKRIIDVLSVYDELIENNQKQIKLLEEAARRLYKEWFVDLHFPEHEKTKSVDGVPEGWHMGTVQEVIEYHDTKRKPLSGQQREKMKGEYRYYGAAGILDYVNAFLFDGIYLLLGEDGTVVSDNGCPVLQYVTGQFWVNNHAHVLTGKGKYSTEYIYMMFAHMKILDVVTGVAQPKISQGRLSAKKILIPAPELAVTFDVNAKPYFEKILILENQITKLEEARDRLLPKLMSGEIEL